MENNTKHWQLDNKTWEKTRQNEWPEYKFNLNRYVDSVDDLDEEYQSAIESYFLTGNDESLKKIYKIPHSLLVELWIYPSDDIEVLNRVKERHCRERLNYSEFEAMNDSNASYIKRCSHHRNLGEFKGASKLNGRDWLLEQLLVPLSIDERLAADSKKTRDDVIRIVFNTHCMDFGDFFYRKDRLDTDPCIHKIPYWREAIEESFDNLKDSEDFVYLLEDMDNLVKSNTELHPKQAKLIKDIEAVFNDPNMPELLRQRVKEIRESGYAV
ncbi:hypothetical protein [Pseudoalteromonas spongiae]|uniref:hypothetical protein n=1 Tax=Pseudoalteromonas spongiae TaxID=298657 RepID=UPI003735A047